MRFHGQFPIVLRALCGLTLIVTGCEAAKSHAFDLVEVARTEEKPVFRDSGVADSEVVKRQDAAEPNVDAGMGDAGMNVEDASVQDGGIFECPTGPFVGEFECEIADVVNRFAGSIEFTLTEVSEGKSESSVIDANVWIYVRTDPDAAPPLILPLPARLDGTLHCDRTKPARVALDYAKPFAELVAILDADLDGDLLEANVRFEADYDEEKQSFDGTVTITPAPACIGNLILTRPAER